MNKYVFDKEKWGSLTIFEQMGNIGAEFGRGITAKKQGDEESLKGALYRGLDLFDATVESLLKQKSGRFREVLIARDQFGEALLTDKDDPLLDNYFMQFAIAARLHR